MVIKFFKTQKGGSSASVDYLLNERVKQGTARILKGDEKVTRALIDSMTTKQKTCVGCLAFTEQINDEQKKQIMKEFEYALMPGMKNRVNILWVEHTDKNNLELNFVIPKIDLETGKSFNPYFYKVDFKRIEVFQDLTNIKNNFSNPKEPIREKTTKTLKFESIEARNYDELDKILTELVAQGVIKNRDELIKECNNSNIEITRQNEDGLSLKLPNMAKAKRFKGGIYAKQFREPESITRQITDIETRQREFKQEHNSRNTELIRKLTNELNQEKRRKFKFNREKFRIKNKPNNERLNTNFRSEITNNQRSNARDFISTPINSTEIQNKQYNNKPFLWDSNRDNNIFNNLVKLDEAIPNSKEYDLRNRRQQDIYIRPNEANISAKGQHIYTDQIKEEQDENYRRINQSLRDQNRKIDEFLQGNGRQLQEAGKRLRQTRTRLQEFNTRATIEDKRNANFTEIYVGSARNFKSNIRNTIQEFGRKFSEYIKTKLTELREQSKRDIKSSLFKVGKFIEKNKTKLLEKVLKKDRWIGW